MKYRIVENTYENLSIRFVIETQRFTNSSWTQESGRTFEKEKDAEDWILATIDKDKSETVISSKILGEYE